jgi:hypothetical protein
MESKKLLQETRTMADFTDMLDELSAEVQVILSSGPLSPQDVERLAGTLALAQRVLHDLERVEVRTRGVSRMTAELFQTQERRIRTLRMTCT